MKDDLVSVIILSYNQLDILNETIDSILEQDYHNIEIIISDDGTKEFKNDYYYEYINKRKKNNIKNVIINSNNKNLGVVKNYNKGLSLSNGKYIKFIDGDDVFFNNKSLSELVNFMKENDSLIVTGNMLFCDENMNQLPIANKKIKYFRRYLPLGKNPEIFFKKLAIEDVIPNPAVLFNRKVFELYGVYDEDYMHLDDWTMFLKVVRLGCKIDYLDTITIKYRFGRGVSINKKHNNIFFNDTIKCYKKEIIPYKRQLGYWAYKNAMWRYERGYRFEEYSLVEKLIFFIKNLDTIIMKVPKRMFGVF